MQLTRRSMLRALSAVHCCPLMTTHTPPHSQPGKERKGNADEANSKR